MLRSFRLSRTARWTSALARRRNLWRLARLLPPGLRRRSMMCMERPVRLLGSGPINRMSRAGPMRDEMRGERRIAGLVLPEKPFDAAVRPQPTTARRLGPTEPRHRPSFVPYYHPAPPPLLSRTHFASTHAHVLNTSCPSPPSLSTT